MRRGRLPAWLLRGRENRLGRVVRENRLLRDALLGFGRSDEPPEDPYAYVMAPKRPIQPHLSGAEKKKLDED